MKITTKKLQQIIEEAVKEVMTTLNESEVFVDEEGYAHDDEGNKWYVGTQYAGGEYRPGELPHHEPAQDLRRQTGGRTFPRRKKPWKRY